MSIDFQRRNLLTAAAAAAVLSPRIGRAAGSDIAVAQIGPFTGMPAPDATEVNQGIKAAFAQINAAGGVNGRKLALFELDDGYKDDGFVQRFREAMQRKPVALLSPVGTRSIRRMLDDKLLDTNDAVVLNAIPGAESLRTPGHPRLFHIRAGDRQQVERIIRHASTLGMKQMAVLYQDVPIGKSGLAAAAKTAEGLNVKLAGFMVPANAPAAGDAASRAAATQSHSALVLGAPHFVADGIAALRKSGHAKAIYALSYVPPGMVKQAAGDASRGVALAQVFPNPVGTTMVLQHRFQDAMKHAAAAKPWTAFHLEGYVTAQVLSEALRRGRDASPAGLARSLRAMGDVDLGGYHVDFSRDNVGSSFVDIAVIGGDGRLVY